MCPRNWDAFLFEAFSNTFVFLALQNGGTALFLAAQEGHLDIVLLLVYAGADLNKGDITPLEVAEQEEQDAGNCNVQYLGCKKLVDMMYSQWLVS